MARNQKALQPVDERIASLLERLVKHASLSRRELSAQTGMSTNRLGIILRHESPPATVGEIGAFARALGTTASAIIAAAEEGVDVGSFVDTLEREHASKQDYDRAARKRSKDRGEGVID